MNEIKKHHDSINIYRPNSHPAFKPHNLIMKLLYIVLGLLSVILVFAIYFNTLEGPYIFDDYPNIIDNFHIRITQLSLKGLIDAGFKSVASNRPIANISFALNFYFHQYNVFGYHLVNVIIHILAGLFLFLLIRDTLRITHKIPSGLDIHESVKPTLLAFVVAIIWLVHPLQTESVSYIVQRMNSMATMFYVLSIWCYVKGRLTKSTMRWSLYAGCLISALLALGTKEIAATLPVFIFLYEWYFFQDLDKLWIKRKIIPILIVSAVLLVLLYLLFGRNFLQSMALSYQVREFTITQRLFTELRVVMLYISLILFPSPLWLNLEYNFPLSLSLFHPITTLFSFVFLSGVLILAIILARKERLISFCILWFLGNLAIESSVLPLELVFEHRTYLPSMFLILLIIVIAYRFLRKEWITVGIISIIVTVFCIWTYQRNSVWSYEGALLQDCLKKSPYSARCYNNLAEYYIRHSEYDKSLKLLFESLKYTKSYQYVIYGNIGYAYLKKNQYDKAIYYLNQAGNTLSFTPQYNAIIFLGFALEKSGRLSEALIQYQKAIQENPNSDLAHNYLGKFLAKNGSIEEGKAQIMEALRLNPAYLDAYISMANILQQQGKINEAINYYRQALKIDPISVDAYYNLGIVLAKQGREIEAIDSFTQAIKYSTINFPDARKYLAELYFKRGELQKTIEQCQQLLLFNQDDTKTKQILAEVLDHKNKIDTNIIRVRRAIKSNPQNPALYYQLGDLLRMEGNFDEAIRCYQKSIFIFPRFSQAYQQIAVIYSLKGDDAEAVSFLQKIIEVNPDDPNSYYNLACLYSKMNNVGESTRWLKSAVDKGFHNIDLLRTDKDLTNIRNTSYYKGLIQRGG